ncbi:MAG: hypothetical protein SFW67_20420 [Myxococcaceae bacterium]|nr:hypothetical protein [Myxococcaceae bacterium]
MATASRPFHFFRAGGFDQVRFDSGADLLAIDQLDQKLWVALACPTKGLAFDSRTLELIDSDKDGRIRAPELIAAVKWVGGLLKNPDDLLKCSAELPLSAINEANDEGQKLVAAIKTVLGGLGKGSATSISVADTAEATKAFDNLPNNGDGVVVAEAAKDDATKQLIADVIACHGAAKDRSGKDGVTAETLQAFFGDVASHVAWLAKAEGDGAPLVLKGDTGAAWEALNAVRGKVDDFFARCRLAAFDARALQALNREEKEYLAVAAKDLTITADEVAGFPLSRIEANRALPMKDGVNPAWAVKLATFAEKTVKPLLGEKAALTEAEWTGLCGKLAAYEAWQKDKAGAKVEKLGAARLKALSTADARTAIDALITDDKAQAATGALLTSVEKLVRLHRDLFHLVNNFVSFKDFYERKDKAIFQVGTLFLDQRTCELCIRVEDAGKHGTMAPLSRAYLAYVDCVRPASGEKMTVAAAFTAGDSDNLMVGRNGIFYDRDGKDWDATITKIVDNPISIRQAFWSPYKKLIRFIEEQVARRAQAADADANEKLTAKATAVEKSAEAGAAKPPEKKFDVGVVAALGVAVGGITAALGALLEAFFGLGFWMPLGLVGLMLLISGPSMLIAWLKLRQRNIGPLLDANGWAVNANARLNVPFGESLTRTAVLPSGSRLDTVDPFAEERKPWGLYLTLVAVVLLAGLWYFGKLDFLPQAVRSTTVLGANAPAYKDAAPAAKDAAPAKDKAPDAAPTK